MRDMDPTMMEIREARDKDTMSISACLNRIMLKIEQETFNDSTKEVLKEDFNYVEKKLGICPEEAALLSCVLENSNGFHTCDDEDLAQFMGCTNIEFISFRGYLDTLAQKRIVRIAKNRGGMSYIVLREACQAIIEDKEFSEKNFAGLTTEEMFSQMRKLFGSFRAEEITEEMLLSDLNMLVDVNPDNLFCQRIKECGIRGFSDDEQRIFYYLCHRYVSFGEKDVDFRTVGDLISNEVDGQKLYRHFQAGKMKAQVNGLICFGGEDGLMDKSIASLSGKVRDTYFSEVDLFCEERVEGHKDLVCCENIKEKEMFYNAPEQEQISRLDGLLEDEHFKGIQDRLEEMGMRKGFNIILYGGPGTGKTETTLQLARKTGRDVLCIDVSQLKSKWVGESEKNVKGVFNTYRTLCKRKGKTPILFFNEADAIFSKRIENVERSVDQMYNALQNIILQEMENLEGIMICTTNLHGNLDPAFERRFLYKIELEKPGEEVRSKIWASMMKGYTQDEYASLGRKYPFSGGQIENVVRKSTVDYILSGNRPTIENIYKFCDEEVFKSKVRKVGF